MKKAYNYDFRDFSFFNDINKLQEYIDERPYSHTSYFHYTSLNTIDKILENNSIWISCVKGFNDNLDKGAFDETEQNFYYSLCFSGGISENLPLWYLYSGVDGKGGKFRLTPDKIKKLIENSEYYLYQKKDGVISKDTLLLDRPLNKDDMDSQFKDIIYYSKNNDGESLNVSLKYNTMTNYNIDYKVFKREYINKNKGFCKSLIWFYEKEVRLLLKLKGEARKKVEEILEKDNKAEFVIILDFNVIKEVIRKNIKIVLAPNHTNINQSLSDYKHIKAINREYSKVYLSKYNGTIDMKIKCNCQQSK